MPNPKNIEKHRFKKGESGNSAGRPKKLPELDYLLADVLGGEDGVEEARLILIALRNKAKKGDVRAAEIILDRAYGKAKQDVKLSGLNEVIVHYRRNPDV